MVTLTNEERDALSPGQLKAHHAAEEKIVFGEDLEKKKGVPVEKGHGALGHETNNHFNGIRKYEGEEAYWLAIEEIHKRDPERAKKLGLPKPRSKAA